mmetsp:Transcript_15458/g.20915  ORF Transcript_15458/g.20915 Transcript_15458/m.20915 type:complete len:220 (-) Transcript_15458:126-785(-)
MGIQTEDINIQKDRSGEIYQIASFSIDDTLKMMGAKRLFERSSTRPKRSNSQSSVSSPAHISHSNISDVNTVQDEEFSQTKSPKKTVFGIYTNSTAITARSPDNSYSLTPQSCKYIDQSHSLPTKRSRTCANSTQHGVTVPAMTALETTFGDATAIFPEARKASGGQDVDLFGVLDAILSDEKETDNESDQKEVYTTSTVFAFSGKANERVAYCVPLLK